MYCGQDWGLVLPQTSRCRFSSACEQARCPFPPNSSETATSYREDSTGPEPNTFSKREADGTSSASREEERCPTEQNSSEDGASRTHWPLETETQQASSLTKTKYKKTPWASCGYKNPNALCGPVLRERTHGCSPPNSAATELQAQPRQCS